MQPNSERLMDLVTICQRENETNSLETPFVAQVKKL